MEIQEFFCHSNFLWNQIIGNLDSKISKMGILTILEGLDFDFWHILTLEMFTKLKNQSLWDCQNGCLWDSNWPKLISRKIWETEKFLVFSTLCNNYLMYHLMLQLHTGIEYSVLRTNFVGLNPWTKSPFGDHPIDEFFANQSLISHLYARKSYTREQTLSINSVSRVCFWSTTA